MDAEGVVRKGGCTKQSCFKILISPHLTWSLLFNMGGLGREGEKYCFFFLKPIIKVGKTLEMGKERKREWEDREIRDQRSSFRKDH